MPELKPPLHVLDDANGTRASGRDQDLKQDAPSAAVNSGQETGRQEQGSAHAEADYLVKPLDWSIRVAVHKGVDHDNSAAGTGSNAQRSSPADVRLELSTHFAPLHLQVGLMELVLFFKNWRKR